MVIRLLLEGLGHAVEIVGSGPAALEAFDGGGFDTVLAPWADSTIQQWNINPSGSSLLSFSGWRLAIFGLALILVMRYRPEGLVPSRRMAAELHEAH